MVRQVQVFARPEICCCGRSTCASTSGLQTGVVAVWQAEVLRQGGGAGDMGGLAAQWGEGNGGTPLAAIIATSF